MHVVKGEKEGGGRCNKKAAEVITPHNFNNKRATNLGFGHLVRKLLAQRVAKGIHAGVGRKGNRL